MQNRNLEFAGESAEDDDELLFEDDSGDYVSVAKGDVALWEYLEAGDVCKFVSLADDPDHTLDVTLPQTAAVVVESTPEPVPQASPTYKSALLENGRSVKVPPHVRDGETVIIRLPSEEYGGKE